MFEFATATRIIFGPGVARQAADIAKSFGSKPLLVTGNNQSRSEWLVASLRERQLEPSIFSVSGEPSVQVVNEGMARAKLHQCDCVIALGGGSAIDAGKAIAAMLANSGELLDYLEVVGRGNALSKPSAPFIAIPTTAGTGSEVTRNAVLAAPEHRVKASLRSPLMLPRVAIIDPELAQALPQEVTATTGLDALTQLIEPYVCARANPITNTLCADGIRRASRSLKRAWENGAETEAREDMALASLFGGLALANAGLGAVHGFAGPIGGMFDAPHGAICAALLPHVMTANIRALEQRAKGDPALGRYDVVGRLLTDRADARRQDGIEWIRKLVSDLQIPALSKYGIDRNDVPQIVDKSLHASSMKANPIALTRDELENILSAAL